MERGSALSPEDPPLIAPAPWELHARGYIFVLRLPPAMLADGCFIPAELRDRRTGSFSYAMFVDYTDSPVGPYRELLLIPGAFLFGQRKHWSITKIYVSSQASVDNGRRNWGIPKELAAFEVEYGEDRVDRIAMRIAGETVVELTLRHYPFGFPLFGSLVPARLRTLCQVLDDQRFTLAPTAHGSLRAAKLLTAKVDPAAFPAFSPEHVVAVVRTNNVVLSFPKAEIEPNG